MGYDFESLYKGTASFPVGLFGQNSYIAEPHHHQEFELFYMNKGSAKISYKENEYVMTSGYVFFINPGIDHCVTEQNESFYYQKNCCRKSSQQLRFCRKTVLERKLP